jgi:hypothetical protein
MVQAAEDGGRDQVTGGGCPTRSEPARACGRLGAQTAMRAAVVVADVLAQNALGVALAEDQDVIEAVATERSHQALTNRVCQRRPRGFARSRRWCARLVRRVALHVRGLVLGRKLKGARALGRSASRRIFWGTRERMRRSVSSAMSEAVQAFALVRSAVDRAPSRRLIQRSRAAITSASTSRTSLRQRPSSTVRAYCFTATWLRAAVLTMRCPAVGTAGVDEVVPAVTFAQVDELRAKDALSTPSRHLGWKREM